MALTWHLHPLGKRKEEGSDRSDILGKGYAQPSLHLLRSLIRTQVPRAEAVGPGSCLKVIQPHLLITQMSKPRPLEVKAPAQGHKGGTAGAWSQTGFKC